MSITLELMDWIKLFMILSALIGNAVWIARTVKDLKDSYKNIEEKISKMENKLESRITEVEKELGKEINQLEDKFGNKLAEVEKELRYELHEKVDKRQYYDDIGGWRTDIRELRKTVIEILKKGVSQ